MPITPLPIRQQIIKLRKKDKLSIGDIAKIVSKSKSVVHGILKVYNDTGLCEAKKSPGRPRITTKREDRAMVNLVKKDRFKTAAAVSREMSIQLDKPLSRKTVSRRLVEQNLLARVPVVKPLISAKNKNRRLQFATEHVLWSQEKWQTVHFSDESKFMLYGSDGKTYVRRKVGEQLSPKCIKTSVKFGGGSVMVWGMISGDGVGPIVRLHGKVNAVVYKQLVKDHVLPVLRNSNKQPAIFMQDNAPCHKAKLVMNFLEAEHIAVLDWPAQSPDLNPIENVWKILGERAKARNPKTTEELWDALKEEWNKITKREIKKLIASCSRRCQSVIEAKGLHTKY